MNNRFKIDPDQMYWFRRVTDDQEWVYGVHGKDLTKEEKAELKKRNGR